MNPLLSLRVSGPHIISEILDCEAIVINLNLGIYYSLREAGAAAWQDICQGITYADLVQQITASYAGDQAAIADSLDDLIGQLAAEEMVTLSEDEPAVTRPAPPLSSVRPPFQPPVLERFTDMQDLLLLDPIHEVDDQGWPASKPTTSPQSVSI